jgi:hypothetical protein
MLQTTERPALAYGESISRRVGQVTIRITNNSKVEGNYLLVVEHGPRRLDDWVEQFPTLDAARDLANEWREAWSTGKAPHEVTRPDTLRVVRARRQRLAPASMKALIAGELHPTGEIRTQREHAVATLNSLTGRGLAVKLSDGVYRTTADGVLACRAEMQRLAELDRPQHSKMVEYAQGYRTLYGLSVAPVSAEPFARVLVTA